MLGGLRGDLLGEDLVEEVGVGQLLAGRLLQEGFEPVAALEQAQALQVLLKALELGGGHAGTSARIGSSAPAASGAAFRPGVAISVSTRSASYTARSRISTIVADVVDRVGDGVECCRRAVRAGSGRVFGEDADLMLAAELGVLGHRRPAVQDLQPAVAAVDLDGLARSAGTAPSSGWCRR